MTNPPVFLFVLILFFTVCSGRPEIWAADLQGSHQAENRICELEEAYLTNFKTASHDKNLAIWHDKFLGWPQGMPRPTDKAAVSAWTRQRNPEPGSWRYRIERSGIRVVGETAVNHYVLHTSGTKTRITHTWIRQDGRWRILGGMSSH